MVIMCAIYYLKLLRKIFCVSFIFQVIGFSEKLNKKSKEDTKEGQYINHEIFIIQTKIMLININF